MYGDHYVRLSEVPLVQARCKVERTDSQTIYTRKYVGLSSRKSVSYNVLSGTISRPREVEIEWWL